MESPDERLIALVDARPRAALQTEAYRHVGPGYGPLSGTGARIMGGRWNPPDSFPVVYVALERESVIAEFYRRAHREGRSPEDLLPRHLYRLEVRLQALLDLTATEAREAVGLPISAMQDDDPSRCQATGSAAHYSGFEGVLAPSATDVGTTLAVFMDRLQAGSAIEPLERETWESLPLETT